MSSEDNIFKCFIRRNNHEFNEQSFICNDHNHSVIQQLKQYKRLDTFVLWKDPITRYYYYYSVRQTTIFILETTMEWNFVVLPKTHKKKPEIQKRFSGKHVSRSSLFNNHNTTQHTNKKNKNHSKKPPQSTHNWIKRLDIIHNIFLPFYTYSCFVCLCWDFYRGFEDLLHWKQSIEWSLR